VLHIEKPGFLAMSDQPINRDKLKRGELDMFRDFFEQVQGEAMDAEQNQALQAVIAAIHKAEGETA
jgi:exonuclease SbcD